MADSTQPSDEDKIAAEKKAKARERNRRYRERHPEAGRQYYLKNREKILRKCREYRQKNAEAEKERDRRYYESNKDKIKAWNKSPAGRASQKRHWQNIAKDPARLEARRKKDRVYSKRYRERHPSRKKESAKKYRDKNKHKQRDAYLRRIKKGGEAHRKAMAEAARRHRVKFYNTHGACYTTLRARTDKAFAVMKSIRNRIDLAIKHFGATKKDRTLALVGCSVLKLISHIEAKFQPGMSWKNRGKWHIDHIIPVSAFNITDPEQQAAAFHYTNLQPLWARDNLIKNDKLQDQHLFGFAYAAKIADAASAKPKKRQRHGRKHGSN